MSDEVFFVEEADSGERLDKMLAKKFSEVRSRTYFQDLIEQGRVFVNGKSAKKRELVKDGDEIEVHFIYSSEIKLEPENIALDILFEDEHILIINKPPGMVVHPAPGHYRGTFVNALLYHLGQEFSEARYDPLDPKSFPRPGIVHRLDKETSGLLVAAKNARTQQLMMELFAQRKVYKEYFAICAGNPGEKKIELPIGRHPTKRKLMTVLQEGGRMAVTNVKTLSYNEQFSAVKMVIETGRTHQIRVHMQAVKAPVIGDETYGIPSLNASLKAERPLLHARVLKFDHPVTGEAIEVQAPLPVDIEKFCQKLKKFLL